MLEVFHHNIINKHEETYGGVCLGNETPRLSDFVVVVEDCGRYYYSITFLHCSPIYIDQVKTHTQQNPIILIFF